NWNAVSDSSLTTYLQNAYSGDTVEFGDSATNTTLTLNTTVTPAGVTFTNVTQNYDIAGTGKIGGPTSLTKSGAGAVTIATNNDFQGNVSVSEGTLSL